MFFSRGKNKIKGCYTLVKMYQEYIKEIEPDSPYYIDYNTFIKVNTEYLQGIIDYLLNTSLPFKLPYRLGSFQIVKKKIYFKYQQRNYKGSIDWPASIAAGKQVFYTNDHTDGYKYLFYWDRTMCRVENNSRYKFIPCRTVKRRLAYYINNKVRDYLEYK
jgi:hypothetical protein